MKTFWIIWNPDSELPPTRMFDSQEEALGVAVMMCRQHKGRFYVCRAEQLASPEVEVRSLK